MGNHNPGDKPMKVDDVDPDLVSYYEPGGQYWSDAPDAEMKIHFPRKGAASRELLPPMTVPEAMSAAVKKRGKRAVLFQEPPSKIAVDKATKKVPPALARADWRVWSWEKYYGDVRRMARGMMASGFAQHDACTIFGFNAPEWHIAALAAMTAGGKASGVYPSDTPEQFQYKAHHSRSSVIVVETNEHVDVVKSQADQLPYCKVVVVWAQPPATTEIKRADGTSIPVFGFEAFLEMGAIKTSEPELDERVKAIRPGHVATLIYTSGTTGAPKAVMITHDSIVFESRMVVQEGVTTIARGPDEVERVISYLPLSHVAGQMVDILCPIMMTAFLPGACEIYFARPYDLKLGSFGERLRDVKPTLFLGVPRVWEKLAERIKAVGARTTGFKKRIAAWAKSKGLEMAQNQQVGGSGERPSMYNLADKLVLSKVKAALGFDELKFAFTGAAPISVDTLQFFGSLGISINEVYGLSESTGATTWSTDGKHTWGSVGFALTGMEVRVFKVAGSTMIECPRTQALMGPQPEACQGEICCRGRHVMAGYMANPDLGPEHVAEIRKKNAECIDAAGWLHTGDMGVKDVNGMIRIVGRYKELIIGAGGENIAPVPIEDEVKKNGEGVIANIQMIGDRRKFNTALITLTCKGSTGEKPGTNELDGRALELVPGVTTIEQAAKSEEFLKFIEEAIVDACNNGEVCPSNAARIQKFTILPRDFSVEGGELTSTFKLKRSVVEKMYANAIEAMYDDAVPAKQMFVAFKE